MSNFYPLFVENDRILHLKISRLEESADGGEKVNNVEIFERSREWKSLKSLQGLARLEGWELGELKRLHWGTLSSKMFKKVCQSYPKSQSNDSRSAGVEKKFKNVDLNKISLRGDGESSADCQSRTYPQPYPQFSRMSTQLRKKPKNVELQVVGFMLSERMGNRIKHQCEISRGYHLNMSNSFQEKVDLRDKADAERMEILRCGDVERHPGPENRTGGNASQVGTLKVITHNVRGLGEDNKVRHMLNYCSKSLKKSCDTIICLQETFVEKPGKIPFIWRGNVAFTSGLGNSQGCITLLSPHINVIECTEFNNRAHVLVCQKVNEAKASFIVANVYAPNANNAEKVEFFESVLDKVFEYEETYDCNLSLFAGDLNLIFRSEDAINRNFSSQEKRTAQTVGHFLQEGNFEDSWKGKKSNFFTWRRPNSDSFSCLDRIFYKKGVVKLLSIITNWTLSMSDHAAVECVYERINEEPQCRSRITRIDPTLLNDQDSQSRFREELATMLRQIPATWDPHLKLEYSKMCIRTIAEKLQSERKIRNKNEEDLLNEELELSIRALENPSTPDGDKAEIIRHVEDLRSRKEILIDEKGTRLAQKIGTKWYNEGEKSTRYFLRLLNRTMPDSIKELENSEGRTLNTAVEIEAEIVKYYKNLYEDYDKTELRFDNNDGFFDNISEITAESRDKVVKPITKDELRTTLRSCKNSAPGPDGIPYSVWGELWDLLGDIVTEAWAHSLSTGKLAPSHKVSFLKLIPKVGKNQKKLTNWRPITLSNCDHKIITKTYANRMSSEIATKIQENQTAYIKGRLINDNIRSLLMFTKIASEEPEMDSLMVSLDAKKAFDSVEHKYIEECLAKFGLSNFVPIFRVLYSELRSDILINGKVVPGFKIKRGVKQGDSLSCILFVMAVEPLLRNIENNGQIEPVLSTNLGALPKSFAYADDVTCVMRRNLSSLKTLFKEYERLTRRSGLELNADKTEIMKINQRNHLPHEEFNVDYLGTTHVVKCKPEVKINGIYFQLQENQMKDANVDAVIARADRHFRMWARRGLSTLGKVLIVKTFGISQAIFLMQSMVLNECHFKRINAVLYKFIWNRHYQASKAPERIKREIMNKPIKQGGLGMLDIASLDDSLKLRAFGRLLGTSHPMLMLLREKLDLTDYFFPKGTVVDGIAARGIDLLKIDRQSIWDEGHRVGEMKFIQMVRSIKLKNIFTENGKRSIPYFRIVVRGLTKIGQLTRQDWAQLKKYTKYRKLQPIVDSIVEGNYQAIPDLTEEERELYPIGKGFANLRTLKSKTIRESRADKEPLCLFKIGLILTPSESLNFFDKVNKLTSTKHKNSLLRTLHGEIYTKEKLFRFGLVQDPNCENCNQVETLLHKVQDCARVRAIWELALEATDKLRLALTDNPNEELTQRILGACLDSNQTLVTIHAEILTRILMARTALPPPNIFLQSVLLTTLSREKKDRAREKIESLLVDYYSF